ncbi:MAG: glycosyltransferase [Methylococcaceae bacterium]|nr:glycosyltransferase [Methylococcaceae bacterium]
MTPHRICLSGEFTPGSLGASWTRAFEAFGLKVLRFDVNEESRKLHWMLRNRYSHRATIRNYFLRWLGSKNYNEALYRTVVSNDAEVLVLHNGCFVFPETIERLQQGGVKVVVFHADNPFPPHYNNRPETLPVARVSDLYLIWSERLVDRLRAVGVPNPRFLPFAWDEEVFPYEQPPEQSWEGVLFVGNWDPQREAFLDRIAERFPLKIYGASYWGTRTRRNGLARKSWMGDVLLGPDAAKVLRKSAICLNILRTQHYVDGTADGLIMRHFEVPGAGGFLLSTRSGGATRLFPEGISADYFDDVEECMAKVDKYLADSSARRNIAAQAHEEITAAHRYMHRAGVILKWLS